MEYITLANSNLRVSRLCMGGCQMGGYGWGKVVEQELIDSVHAALDHGVTFFDTAETYGLGQSEITLGKALGARRTSVVISDKFGVHARRGYPTFYDNSRDYILKACERSLKRLGTDYIDVYTVHYRDGHTPLSDVVDTLELLRGQGKIRYFALSNIGKPDMPELAQLQEMFVSFQCEYSLACRKNEHNMVELSTEYGLTPLTWGSLGQGILTGKYTKDNVFFDSGDRRSREAYVNFHGEKLLKNLEIVNTLKQIASKCGKPVSAVAIRFILDYLPGSVVLCGAKHSEQVLENIKGMDWRLADEDIYQLDRISDKGW